MKLLVIYLVIATLLAAVSLAANLDVDADKHRGGIVLKDVKSITHGTSSKRDDPDRD